MRLGVAALARPTFDVEFAEKTAADARETLENLGYETVGPDALVLDIDAVRRTVDELGSAGVDATVVFQATFTDASLVEPFSFLPGPLVLWAFPEERTGGRLRLNSLCGINLAAYTLGRRGRPYGWVYRHPGDPAVRTEIAGALDRTSVPISVAASPSDPSAYAAARAEGVVRLLGSATIGVVGDAPTGFDPSTYDPLTLGALTGTSPDRVDLSDVFAATRSMPLQRIDVIGDAVAIQIDGIRDFPPEPVRTSFALHGALLDLATRRGWSAVAMRCWPETFDALGAAACSALGLIGSGGMPALCERDVYGAVTALAMEHLAESPSFVADMVDIDRTTNTAALWHCGVAPPSMAATEHPPRATVHSNRGLPLVSEFALRPGRVTIARLSRARNRHALAVCSGVVTDAPLPFSGTSGVVRLDHPVEEVLGTVMSESLEHHYCLVYGDLREDLSALAHAWGIPVIGM